MVPRGCDRVATGTLTPDPSPEGEKRNSQVPQKVW